MNNGELTKEELQTLGRQSLHVPDHHPAQGRGDPDELPRARHPARVDLAHLRPRRRRHEPWRDRVLVRARRGARRRPRDDDERAARASRRTLCLRGVPDLLPPEAVDRSGRLVSHRALRPGRDQDPARGDGEALSVDRPGRPRLLPRAPAPRAGRRAVRARPRRRALPDVRGAAEGGRGAFVQARHALGSARRDRPGRHPPEGARS